MMAETTGEEKQTPWRKAEALIFPLAASIIGVGYACAILVNNALERVFRSPHALLLLAMFCAITFFSVRSLVQEIRNESENGD